MIFSIKVKHNYNGHMGTKLKFVLKFHKQFRPPNLCGLKQESVGRTVML